MNDFLKEFADVTSELNQSVPAFANQGNTYQPGIGPYTEKEIVNRVVNILVDRSIIQNAFIQPNATTRRHIGLQNYMGLNNRAATPDLVFDNTIIEFKICRPLRDNGQREDTWFKKVFEPNSQSYSTFLDVAKLCRFRDNYDNNNDWQKWAIIIGFERQNETEYPLDLYFPDLFNFISSNIVNSPYAEFITETRDMGVTHRYHQILKLYGFKY